MSLESDLADISADVSEGVDALRSVEDELDRVVNTANILLLVIISVIAAFCFMVFLGAGGNGKGA